MLRSVHEVGQIATRAVMLLEPPKIETYDDKARPSEAGVLTLQFCHSSSEKIVSISRFRRDVEFVSAESKTGPLGCAELLSAGLPEIIQRFNSTEARPGLLLCHSASSSSFSLSVEL